MRYKQLGSTQIQLPEIGLGTWAYTGGPEPIRRGIELGASLIDTAESYGTEQIVGRAIRDIRDQVFVATKVSPEHFRKQDLLEAANQSLQRLGIDYIDLYQLHWPNPEIPIVETAGAMESLVQSGKVRFIGVSNFSIAQIQRMQAIMPRTPIVSNQVEYSLMARGIELDLLPFCQENSITVIAYSPLARGFNFRTPESIKKPLGEYLFPSDLDRTINDIAAISGKTAAQVMLNWCITNEEVIAIPKANSTAHVEEDCMASGWQLTDEQLALIDKFAPILQRHTV